MPWGERGGSGISVHAGNNSLDILWQAVAMDVASVLYPISLLSSARRLLKSMDFQLSAGAFSSLPAAAVSGTLAVGVVWCCCFPGTSLVD